ncbi:MAG: SHOCT domain-containing protein [Ruminococcus sp.]|nr:SHOCT domain-containing protein [Ruminococcus sp.]
MENQVIRSERISQKKKIVITYIIIAVVLLLSLIPTISDYNTYIDGQETAISLIDAVSSSSEFDLDAYDTRQEKAAYLYDKLNQNKYSVYNSKYGYTLSNSDEVDALRKVDEALGDCLSDLGYDCWYGSRYLEYRYFITYFINNITVFTVISTLMIALLLATFIVNICYLYKRNKEIIIDDELVICKKSKSKQLQFKISDVNSVEMTRSNGLLIKGNGVNYRIKWIRNVDEIRNRLLGQKYVVTPSDNSEITNAVPAQPSGNESVNELKKLKELLDTGAITQEEFDAKKKQILGI